MAFPIAPGPPKGGEGTGVRENGGAETSGSLPEGGSPADGLPGISLTVVTSSSRGPPLLFNESPVLSPNERDYRAWCGRHIPWGVGP